MNAYWLTSGQLLLLVETSCLGGTKWVHGQHHRLQTRFSRGSVFTPMALLQGTHMRSWRWLYELLRHPESGVDISQDTAFAAHAFA